MSPLFLAMLGSLGLLEVQAGPRCRRVVAAKNHPDRYAHINVVIVKAAANHQRATIMCLAGSSGLAAAGAACSALFCPVLPYKTGEIRPLFTLHTRWAILA